ncbi:hypothetical protein OsJ_17473 [Oryza sativa Japonica Group]|uniref:Uncharacterized protein n=1 Tax=Oryza sativa subsp. japonica TaxID=39947 RepID=B9FMZ8_ORYSJ|nr:hypothetical protein OsJ_17473 [Oryza sativa Japonica Group]
MAAAAAAAAARRKQELEWTGRVTAAAPAATADEAWALLSDFLAFHRLRWEFECEPVAGTAKEALAARLQDGIDGMARRVQEALAGRRGDAAAAAAVAMEAANSGDVNKLGTSIAV